MRKIVCLFTNNVYGNTGGDIETKKIFNCLKSIGSNKNNIKLIVYSLDQKRLLDNNFIEFKKLNKNRKKDMFSRFFLHSTYFYFEWKRIKKKIFSEIKPDVIVLGNSRLGFVIDEIRKYLPETKIVTQFHNVEYDISKVYALNYHGLKKKIFELIEEYSVKKDERKAFKFSDSNLFLTHRDVLRCEELYGKNNLINEIIPITVEDVDNKLNFFNNFDLNYIFLGSLDYPSNKEAIIWFLKEVWEKVNVKQLNIQLIIAGKNPDKNLVCLLEKCKNVKFYPNFKSKEAIIPINSIFLSPIKTGGGMKVKIAEALSMGLKVIGTTESLIGYEEALESKNGKKFILEFNTAAEFLNFIGKNTKIDAFEKEEIYGLFKKYYSFESVINKIEKILIK